MNFHGRDLLLEMAAEAHGSEEDVTSCLVRAAYQTSYGLTIGEAKELHAELLSVADRIVDVCVASKECL